VQYTFEPITSNAALGDNNLPFRAGEYNVTVTYSQRGGVSGEVTSKLTILPAPLQVSGIEVESRVYDATIYAEYSFGNMYLLGVFGNDDVELSVESATVQFHQPDANPNARVIINGVALIGEDIHNYYLAPVDTYAAITPRPLYLNIEVDSRIYDGTNLATITSNPELNGVLSGDDVRIAPEIEANFVQSTVGTDISVYIAQGALVGVHAHNYYIAEIEGFGNIYPRILTVMPTVTETRIYDATTELTITSAHLQNIRDGDDVHIATLNAGELSSPDAGIREVVFNFQLTGADAFNYVVEQPEGVTVEITPKPITVDVELDSTITMSNEARIVGTSLNTILPRDEGQVSLAYGYFALFAPRAYLPPPNERFVTVHFSSFALTGDRALNYKLIEPEGGNMELDRALMPGMVRIENSDSRLRIGSQLFFSNDIPFFSPSLWERVWFVGGRNPEHIVARGFGMDTMDLDIIHQYVDQRVYLKLVSINDRYEVWAINPTDYVPFTIVTGIDQQSFGAIMGTDDVWMNNPSDRGATRRQTYSASHGRHIDIEFNLWGLANGRNSIYFNHPNIADTRNSTTAVRSSARYTVNPADAVDGVITINAAFVHRGVNLGVANHTFPAVNCGFVPATHTLTVTNIGNAPTNAMTVSRTNPTQYNISATTIPSIAIGGSASVNVSPVAGQLANAAGTTEAALGTRTITSTVTVTGNDIIARTANYSMTINHTFPTWAGRHGSLSHCQRHCTHAACNAIHQLTHGWSSWSGWSQGAGTTHTRSRSCTRCNRPASESASCDESSTGGWTTHVVQTCTQGGSYSRPRSCSTCSRFMRTEWYSSNALGHTMGSWSQTTAPTCIATGTDTRRCTRCSGNTQTRTVAALGHDWVWDDADQGHTCSRCGFPSLTGSCCTS
jgi:hypothetical protein